MKVYITVVVENEGDTDFSPVFRERFVVEAGTAPVQEICENAQVETYNVVERLVEEARAKSGG